MMAQQSLESIINEIPDSTLKDVLEQEVAAQKSEEKNKKESSSKDNDEKKEDKNGKWSFEWAKKCGKDLKFDGMKVEKIGNWTEDATFSCSNAVDDTMGNVFNVSIKFKKLSWYGTMFGFTSMANGGIKAYDKKIGIPPNKQTCFGFMINTKINKISMYGPDAFMKGLEYRSKEKWKSGDMITMSFDFKADVLKIYHDDVHAETIKLNGIKTIVPAFTLSSPGDQIEIIQSAVLDHAN